MQNKERNLSLDIMKTILVLGMISAHVFQLCYNDNGGSKLISLYSLFINIVTFSSFMFCFGCASYLAYLSKEKNIIGHRLIKNFLRLLICFYISGFTYQILINKQHDLYEYIKVLLLWKIPGYSEFIISFAFLNMILLLFHKMIQDTVNSTKLIGGVTMVALSSTFIPYSMVQIPQLGIICGTTKFSCFPLLQYLPYFLVGAYCQSKRQFYNRKLMYAAVLFTITVSGGCALWHKIPPRFPPSIGWILWASAFTLLYYMISDKISKLKLNLASRNFIQIFGAYTLDYLVISNIIIFYLRGYWGKTFSFIYCIAIIIIIYVLCYIYGILKLKNKHAKKN